MISSSSSNWLDRLRSSRGFPTGEEPDLDRFISSSSSGSAESATQSAPPRREKLPKWAPPPGEFAGVLCDLFNMGGEAEKASRKFARKKASRKQANPKFFSGDLLLPSSSNSENNGLNEIRDSINGIRDSTTANNNSNSNGNDGINVRVEDELNLRGVIEDGGDDEVDVDLKEYTRSEVTVIDTSFEEWKSDKWVFRKNDEWRIKDKKNKLKSRVCGAKKKKLLVSDLGDKKLVDDDQLMMKKKEDESSLHLNKRQPQNVKERQPFREREVYVGKVPKKRFPCPRPPEKVIRNEASPVVLIKSIPLNDTNTAVKISKTSLKKRPKQMKIV